VAVKIKLKRFGKIHSPHYRVVVADSRTARNGPAIEEIGIYNPQGEPSLIEINSERVAYWLGVGAQPTEPVMALLKVTGDWQKHKKIDGAAGSLKVRDKKQSRDDYFAAMVAQSEKDKEKAAKSPPEEFKPRKKKSEEAAAESAPEAAAPEAAASAEATDAEPTAEAAAPEAPAAESAAPEAAPETPETPAPESATAEESTPETPPAPAEESPQA
jgi:small subunit ribosomal protein S16